jgi:hypothetical protein
MPQEQGRLSILFRLLLVVTFLTNGSLAASAQEATAASGLTDIIRAESRPELSQPEKAFLECSLQCRNNANTVFECLDSCKDRSNLPPESIPNVMSLNLGFGVTEEECVSRLPSNSFVCPEFGTGCCCEGFFDCKRMEELVNGCRVSVCGTDPGGRERCTCTF